MKNYDFAGYATKNDRKCTDGITIKQNAFADDDGRRVPLVWMHCHNTPDNVLGHAILENRNDGVYAYCTFNESDAGKNAKLLVQHGDVNALSIFANKLKKNGSDVIHGVIREVSLVLAGANPGALIDQVLAHSDCDEEEYEIILGSNEEIEHSCESEKKDKEIEHMDPKEKAAEKPAAENKEDKKGKTVKEIFDELTEEQKNVVYALIGQAVEDTKSEISNNKGENDNMKHNAFETETTNESVLSHDAICEIIGNAKAGEAKSLKNEFLAHAADYGIENIGLLFPDYKAVTKTPSIIDRDQTWVKKFMAGVHHTPFSRIKTLFADITEDEARAKGYITGDLKLEEVFPVMQRVTDPQTIYKKQKLDRDDIIDIVDFDVVAWIKAEMRGKLDEEIALAALLTDGRSVMSREKIKEDHIRPIWTDDDFYTVHKVVTTPNNADEETIAKMFIRAMRKSRKDYKGKGNPVLFISEDLLTDCLLIEDSTGRLIYDTMDKLKAVLRVSDIQTVPQMAGLTRVVDGVTRSLAGIYLNLDDYSIGADKGGSVNMFEDFDIDFNQEKYLIETRCSGALTAFHGAVAIEFVEGA